LAGTSTVDTLQMQFKTAGVKDFEKEVGGVEQAAKAITESVQKSLDGLKTSINNTLEGFNTTMQSYKATVDAGLADTTLSLKSWTNTAGDFLTKQKDLVVGKLSENVLDPVKNQFEGMGQALGGAYSDISKVTAGFITDSKEEITQLGTTFYDAVVPAFDSVKIKTNELVDDIKRTYPKVTEVVERIATSSSEFLKKHTESVMGWATTQVQGLMDTFKGFGEEVKQKGFLGLATEIPKILRDSYAQIRSEFFKNQSPLTKALQGPWLAAEAGVMKVTSLALGLPQTIKDTYDKVSDYGTKIVKTIKDVQLKIEGGWKALKNFGAQLKTNITNAGKFLGKITGVSTALRALKRMTSFTFKITGAMALVSIVSNVLGDFWDFWEILQDSLIAVMTPISNVLNEIIIELVPIIQTVLVPLINMSASVLKDVLKIIQGLMSEGSGFKGMLTSLVTVLAKVGKIIGQVIGKTLTALLPSLMQLFQVLVDMVMDFVKLLLPTLIKLFDMLIPVVITLVTALKPLIEAIFTVIKELLPVYMIVLGLMVGIFIDLVKQLLPPMVPAIIEMVKALGELAVALMPIIKLMVQMMGFFLTYLFGPIMIKSMILGAKIASWYLSVLAAAVALVVTVFSTAFNFITAFPRLIADAFSWVISTIESVFKRLWSFITDLPKLVFNAFSWIISTIEGILAGLWDTISSFFMRVIAFLGLKEIGHALKGAWDWIYSLISIPLKLLEAAINAMLLPIKAILGWDPPAIPGGTLGSILGVSVPDVRFAKGGIVTGETLATVGEAGPEAILPLKSDILQRLLPSLIEVQGPETTALPSVVQTSHGASILAAVKGISFPSAVQTEHGGEIVQALQTINAFLGQISGEMQKKEEPIQQHALDFGLLGFI